MGAIRRCFVLVSLLLSIVAFGQWEVEVEPVIEGVDITHVCRFETYKFGIAVGARDNYYDAHDQSMTPPLPAYSCYLYFQDFNPYWNRLAWDFRSTDDDTVYWSFIFMYGGVGTIEEWYLEWDPSDIPSDGDFRIGISYDTAYYAKTYDQPGDPVDWEEAGDMREITSIGVTAPDVYFSHPVIRYIRAPESTSDHPTTPTALTLTAHPNPFNSTVEIEAPNGYIVTITDIDGRHVATLGTGSTRWTPGEGQPSGVYLVKAEGDGKSLTQRIVYMK